MKLSAILLLFASHVALAESAPTNVSEAPATAPPPAVPADPQRDAPPQPDTSVVAPPGNLQEAVIQTLEKFVPSEEIDVDKPVDFPTNI